MNRKEFLHRAGRWSLLGGLTALSAVLLLKREVSVQKCEVNDLCKACNEYSFCSKEQALKQRVNERKQKD